MLGQLFLLWPGCWKIPYFFLVFRSFPSSSILIGMRVETGRPYALLIFLGLGPHWSPPYSCHINSYGSQPTNLQAIMMWEHVKCLAWYSPQSHYWDCSMTLNLLGALDVWSGAWVSMTINVWLYLSNSLTLCIFDSCWPLFIHCLTDNFGMHLAYSHGYPQDVTRASSPTQ